MSFKKTLAFIKGSWDGVPGESNFTQSETVHAALPEFIDYDISKDIANIIDEYVASGDLMNRQKELSADGKVLISTKEYVDEASWTSFREDSRWDQESAVTKGYDVELAAAPEDVGTFHEGNRIYYHSSAHLF